MTGTPVPSGLRITQFEDYQYRVLITWQYIIPVSSHHLISSSQQSLRLRQDGDLGFLTLPGKGMF